MRRFVRFACRFPVVLLAACASASRPAADVASVRATIEETNAKLERWLAAGQVDSVVTAFASDATVMGPNSPAASGTAEIRDLWTRVIGGNSVRWEIQTVAVRVVDSLAVEHGRYALQIRPTPPADTTSGSVEDRGNYLVTWVNRDGRWQILYDIGTSELPPPGAPPAK